MRYRFDIGMMAFVLHRLTGIGLLVYLVLHIVSMSYLALGPAEFNKHMVEFNTPFFKIMEIFLFGPVIFHALNGLRIILVDFLDLTKIQKPLFYGVVALSLVSWIIVGFLMFQHADVFHGRTGAETGLAPVLRMVANV